MALERSWWVSLPTTSLGLNWLLLGGSGKLPWSWARWFVTWISGGLSLLSLLLLAEDWFFLMAQDLHSFFLVPGIAFLTVAPKELPSSKDVTCLTADPVPDHVHGLLPLSIVYMLAGWISLELRRKRIQWHRTWICQSEPGTLAAQTGDLVLLFWRRCCWSGSWDCFLCALPAGRGQDSKKYNTITVNLFHNFEVSWLFVDDHLRGVNLLQLAALSGGKILSLRLVYAVLLAFAKNFVEYVI